ncbi:hypothetical protein [Wenxinia marina]|uniref:Uncharacterized protein n=1 Tax=Wenxinia marina DSM 24838 TaxID=1123501 RepID=A0A0D0QDU1_9RHOB|nr:hypothetical protein [Wenxinia marina]KIQ70532.1 hypothetical protein Wenmar_00908 [Wenxinia marina DSM 24838]GGL52404.1 hypothetical protein GCM10011392_03440 [Wenxinia marina]
MTRILALALAATVGTATLAAADTSYVAIQPAQNASTNLELNLVTSATDATLLIQNLNGTLLGSAPLTAGANTNVKVSLDRTPVTDVIAVIEADGQVLSQDRVEISRM